jgi:hypothetical protein
VSYSVKCRSWSPSASTSPAATPQKSGIAGVASTTSCGKRAFSKRKPAQAPAPAHYTAWFKLHQVLLQLGESDLARQALEQHDLWKERLRPGAEDLAR